MARLNRRKFLRAASGLFVPAILLRSRANIIMPGPVMRPIASAAGCSNLRQSNENTIVSTQDSAAYLGIYLQAAASYEVCKCDVFIKQVNGPGSSTMAASIWSNTGGNLPNAQIGAESSTRNVSDIGTTAEWVTFTWSGAGPSVVSGTFYHVVLRIVSLVTNYFSWTYGTGARMESSNDGVSWSSLGGRLGWYKLYSA